MSITLDIAPADMAIIEQQAAAANQSIENFLKNAIIGIIHENSHSTEHIPNATTMAAIEAAERGEDMHGPYNTVDELMEALNAED